MTTLNINYQLQQGTGLQGEPVRVNAWEVLIPEISSEVHLYANSFNAGGVSIENITINHFNAQAKVAGAPTFEDASLTIRDVLSPDLFRAFYEWRQKVYNVNTAELGFASEYKKRGLAFRYDSKGGLIRTYELINIWPTKVGDGTFEQGDYSGNMIEIALSMDRAVII